MARVTAQFTMKQFKMEIDLDYAPDSDAAEKILQEDLDLYTEEILENVEVEILDGEYDTVKEEEEPEPEPELEKEETTEE